MQINYLCNTIFPTIDTESISVEPMTLMSAVVDVTLAHPGALH